MGKHLPRRFGSVHAHAEIDVHQDKIYVPGGGCEDIERFFAGQGAEHLVAFLLKLEFLYVRKDCLIFDQQYRCFSVIHSSLIFGKRLAKLNTK